jgi:hypothetical protein
MTTVGPRPISPLPSAAGGGTAANIAAAFGGGQSLDERSTRDTKDMKTRRQHLDRINRILGDGTLEGGTIREIKEYFAQGEVKARQNW